MDIKAYTQVYWIIENLSLKEKTKIPKQIINVIKTNISLSYLDEIKKEDIESFNLSENAEKLLSVIYTDYLASEEERKIIKNKEKIINQTSF